MSDSPVFSMCKGITWARSYKHRFWFSRSGMEPDFAFSNHGHWVARILDHSDPPGQLSGCGFRSLATENWGCFLKANNGPQPRPTESEPLRAGQNLHFYQASQWLIRYQSSGTTMVLQQESLHLHPCFPFIKPFTSCFSWTCTAGAWREYH